MFRIRVKHRYRMFKISLASQLLRWANKIESKVVVDSAFAITELYYDEFQEWSINKAREEYGRT